MQDRISDLFTRIRNGHNAYRSYIEMYSSITIESIVKVLKEEGYIRDYVKKATANNKYLICVFLKYYNKEPVIKNIKRVSKPSVRIYCKFKKLPIVLNGLGIAIISTPNGIMSNIKAKELGIGGEVIGFVE
jgi:small subunit ribosomal protein S8